MVGHKLLTSSVADLMNDAEIHFVKTHQLPGDNSPAIYLVRDGRDACVSYAHYRVDFEGNLSWVERQRARVCRRWQFNSALRDVIEGNTPYGAWGRM